MGDPNEPASLHRYLYAYSNPCYYTDENGQFVFLPFLAYALLSGVLAFEGHVIYQETVLGRGYADVDLMAAATFGLKVGVGTAGILISGGSSLGVGGTALMFSGAAGFNIFTCLAHDKKSLIEIDWAGVYASSGVITGIAAYIGPALASKNVLLNYGTRTALSGLGIYGTFEGGKHMYEGVADKDLALFAYGGVESVTSAFGTLQLMKSGVYPRLKQSAQLTEENIAGGASVKSSVANAADDYSSSQKLQAVGADANKN